MNILVTGANGQLGRSIRRLAPYSVHHYIFTDVNDVPGLETTFLDITNPDAVDIIAQSEGADVIVNCAAYTNVDRAEDDAALANMLNAGAVEHLARVAAERNATLIHISTDYIFSGNSSSPIREDALPAPCNVYGSTKLAGEKAVLASGCRHIILRTAWLYSPYGRNFLKSMRKIMLQGSPLRVVYDSVGTPTSAADLAAAIVHIIEEGMLDRCGIYNYSNEGVASWYDYAKAIAAVCAPGSSISPILSSEYYTRARRPQYTVLDKSLFKKTFNLEIPYWVDSLHCCIKELEEYERD